MTPRQVPPVLYVIACGGRPAGQLPDFVRFAQGQGWDVCVIATPELAARRSAAALRSSTLIPTETRRAGR